jgi:hypothetical protein
MNLEKAIEILDLITDTPPSGANQDFVDAVKLGNEAMKRLIAWRNNNDEDLLWDLPGETEN